MQPNEFGDPLLFGTKHFYYPNPKGEKSLIVPLAFDSQ